MAGPRSRFRLTLRNTVSAEARAFGFSLVVVTTGYLSVAEKGLPGRLGALAFLGGALLGQSLAAALAFRSVRETWSSGESVRYVAPASIHLLSVVVGVLAGWGVVAGVGPKDGALAAGAFTAILVYELVTAAELALALDESSLDG